MKQRAMNSQNPRLGAATNDMKTPVIVIPCSVGICVRRVPLIISWLPVLRAKIVFVQFRVHSARSRGVGFAGV